jgi:hypothetical protein
MTDIVGSIIVEPLLHCPSRNEERLLSDGSFDRLEAQFTVIA